MGVPLPGARARGWRFARRGAGGAVAPRQGARWRGWLQTAADGCKGGEVGKCVAVRLTYCFPHHPHPLGGTLTRAWVMCCSRRPATIPLSRQGEQLAAYKCHSHASRAVIARERRDGQQDPAAAVALRAVVWRRRASVGCWTRMPALLAGPLTHNTVSTEVRCIHVANITAVYADNTNRQENKNHPGWQNTITALNYGIYYPSSTPTKSQSTADIIYMEYYESGQRYHL